MAPSRSIRIPSALVVLTALALAPFHHPESLSLKAAPAQAPKKKVGPEDLLAEADAAFGAAKYADAMAKYQETIDKFSGRLEEKMIAALTLRVATCHVLAKKWPEAEAKLKEFLEKFPKGAEDVLDANNNQRAIAQLTLCEVMANQNRFDEAITALTNFEININNTESDRIKARAFRAELIIRKVAKGSSDEKKAADEKAAELLRQLVQTSPLSIPEVKEAGYKLVQIYTRLGQAKEATMLREQLEAKITNPVELVRSNFLKMELGDKYFQQAEELQSTAEAESVAKREGFYKSAIEAYQGVHQRAYIAGFMDKALEEARRRLDAAKAAHPEVAGKKADEVVKAESDLGSLEEMKKSFDANKSYDSLLAYRLGLCLTELHRPWEARIAFREIMEKDPSFEKGDIAHYYYINALNDIRRFKEAQAECKKFVVKYPRSDVLGNVAVMLGEISAHQGEYLQAIENYRWARNNVHGLKPSDAEYIDGAIADAYFRNLDWDDARKGMEYFLTNYPKSAQREVMSYMRALTFFYQGKYRETTAAFDDYNKTYPNGEYSPDVRYRLALVKLGVKPSDDREARANALDVVSRCDKWIEFYADSQSAQVTSQRPEVLTLKADAYQKIADLRTLDKDEKKKYADLAVDAYIAAAMQSGDNKQNLDFLLRELNKTLPSRGEWNRLRDIYQKLYDRDKKSPDALGHLYWIIKCTEKLGKTPEEKLKSSEDAKNILAAAIVDNINDVRQDQVESLVIELAQKLAREVRRRDKLNKEKPGSAEPLDARATLETLLKLRENKDSLIAQARASFALSEIARALRKTDEADAELLKIATRFKPDELSPTLLALVGDLLLAKGKNAQAEPFFAYLKEAHRGSQFADFGFNGLAEIRFAAKKYKEALAIVDDAIENQIVNSKEKDLRFLRARLKIEVGDFKEAKEAFESLAKVKEWRGETTAGCLYYLGVIEERQGDFKEAVNLYNRCYLAWKKYEKYAVKSVYRSALLFAEKLGQRTAAIDTLNKELFKNDNPKLLERYKAVPEWKDAEALLERIK